MPRLHVGTYARNGGGGLYPLTHSERQGWSAGDPYPGAQNASFGAYSARHDLHYLVDEDDGALGVFRRSADGWQGLARLPALGEQPCYVALNAGHDLLAIANYGSGSIALYRLGDRGLPRPPALVRRKAGRGPVADRQDGPHAHCVCFSPDRRWLFHVDLGTDEILGYPLDGASGAIGEPRIAFAAPAGSGPRHLAFHPSLPLALLVSELASTLTVLDVGNGALSARQTLSALPSGFAGESLGGHLSVNAAGDRAYVTNRGHDSIAVFAWDAAGSIALLQHVPSSGASPRAFVLLEAERQLALANEEGGNVVIFDIGRDGTLSPAGAGLAVPGAVFVLVAPA